MQCAVFIAMSLDGFIARKDGGLDWLKRVEQDGEDYGYAAFASSVDALVMGRATYDTVRGFGGPWPYSGKRVVVLTHQPPEDPRAHPHAELVDESAAAVHARLAAAGVTRAYIDGGQVIRQFLAAGLIDDLTISVIPVLLGDGLPLFGPGGAETALTLERATPFSSGLVQLRYRARR